MLTFTRKKLSTSLLLLVLLATATGAMAQTASLLADLVQSGDRRAALELVQAGTNVNTPQPDGSTALHWAVYNSDAELVSLLLKREAEPNTTNLFGSSPLAEAIKVANAELVKLLLDAGANPDSPNQDNQTALMLAASVGSIDIAEMLVAKGANVNAIETFRGQNALMWAAAGNQAAIAQLLIKHGADVNLRAFEEDWGSQISSEPRAQYRLVAGMTPLLFAARGGCQGCVEQMLKAGADIDLPDPNGTNALMIAIDNNHFDMAAYLLAQGANPHSWDWWGRTPLYIATDVKSMGGFGQPGGASNKLNALALMKLLLQAGVNPDPQLNMHRPGRGGGSGRFTDDLLNSGATPLLRAANTLDVESIKLLLEYGAEVDLPNATGVTPLMAAAGFGAPRNLLAGRFGPKDQGAAIASIEALLAAGADINAKVTDTTSFTARLARRTSLTDRTGQNALFGAIKQSWGDVVQYLLEHGADSSIVDARGKTLMDAALGDAGGRIERPIEPMVALLKSLAAEN